MGPHVVMVFIKAPVSGLCSSLGTKPRRIRRSTSTSSVDVLSSVVSRNIWLFENEAFKKASTESLLIQGESEVGNGCCKHSWYLTTNFRPSQQCTKCCKRIPTKRAIHKCTICKKVYHLRCSAELDECSQNHNRRPTEARMDVKDFITVRKSSPLRQPCQVPKTKKRVPFTRLQLNEENSPLEEPEIPDYNIEELLYAPEEASHPEQINETVTSSRKSHKKPALAGMKSSFVKRCKSFKEKMKSKKGKNTQSNSTANIQSTVESESTPELNQQEQTEEKRDAWVKSPVRNRIRAKQAEIRAESIRRRARPYVKSKGRHIKNPSDEDFNEMRDRLEIVEKKLCKLEKVIPMEINSWNELGLKFRLQEEYDDSKRTEGKYNKQGTRPKELEAQGHASLSSGTTSDELFVVPDTSSSSQDDHVTRDHVIKTESQPITEINVTNGFYSSEHDDSSLLPSGIPHKLKLEISGANSQTFSEHQTSTPVTNCELSFRSASKKYAQITHKNITRISTETSDCKEAMDWAHSEYTEKQTDNEGSRNKNPSFEQKNKNRSFEDKTCSNKSFERNRSRNGSYEFSQTQQKVLSPEQIAVRSFLQKRRSGGSYQNSPHRINLSGSSPIASSTFCHGDGINHANISPLAYTMRHDQSNSSQASFSKVMNESNQSERRNRSKSSNQDSPISPVLSELSYTFRNDSQMIQSTGEENLQGYTTNNCYHGYATTHFAQNENAVEFELEESVNGGERVVVEVDIEPDCYIEKETLVGCEPDLVGSGDGASLTNVTECSGDDGSCYADRKEELHRSRWINKDVHMFGSSGGLGAIQDLKTKGSDSRRPGSMDERGDSTKPPLPGRKAPSENDLEINNEFAKSSSFRRAFSEPKVDFIKEAERHLEQYQSRMQRELTGGACMERQQRASVLEVYDEDSEEAVLEQEIVPQNVTRNDAYWKTDETHEFEKMEKELREESIALASRLSRTRSHTDIVESVSPLNEGKYGRSASCTTSVSGEIRQLINENAKYHFLHEKGMIKISSPGLKIVSDSPSSKYTARSHRINDINEENTDIEESGSEIDINDVVVDSKFSLFRNNDIPSHSGASVATLEDIERRQAHVEAQIIQDVMTTVDNHQAVWDNVQNWMARDHSEPGSEELQAELDKLMRQQESDHHSRSPCEDSIYYSFQGQSEELRNVLATGAMSGREQEDKDEHITGLMNVILYGTISQVEQLLNSDTTISEIEIKEATVWALEQKNYPIACLLLDDICRLLVAAEGDACEQAYPAYRKGNHWDPYFIVLSKQNFQGEWDSFMGFHVYRRCYDFVSPEAAVVINSDLVRNNPLSIADFKDVQRAINSACLQKKHSNITVINACPYRSKRGGEILEKERCIVVHCLLKGFIPFNEEPFPEEVDGISTDVREGYFQLGINTPPKSQKSDSQPWDTDSEVSECMTGSGSDQTMSRSNSCTSAESMPCATPASESKLTSVPDAVMDRDGDAVMMGPAGDQQATWLSRMRDASMIDMLKGLDIESSPCIYPGHKSKDFNTNLLMGTCIGPCNGEGSGTLGGFVVTKGGQIGALTCAHVTSGDEGISQPAVAELESESLAKQCMFGTVISRVFDAGSMDETGVDAALISVQQRLPHNGQFIWARKEQLKFAGFEPKSPPRFTKGAILRIDDITPRKRHINVLKYGAETGLTCGKLYLNGQYVRTVNREMRLPSSHEMIEFFNQMEIASIYGTSTRFFDLGDSGSLVFMPLNGSELSCIGLCIGCTSYGSCVVTPIEDVLDKLNLPCQFVDFTSE